MLPFHLIVSLREELVESQSRFSRSLDDSIYRHEHCDAKEYHRLTNENGVAFDKSRTKLAIFVTDDISYSVVRNASGDHIKGVNRALVRSWIDAKTHQMYL